ncbi:hypothetical protein DVP66_10070 [Yersinia enterocolitica]|nr:hypothetical protein [Yersinia enterocolitica]
MKRINSKIDLPKEFNLNKYNALSTMSDKDLFRQVYSRQAYLGGVGSYDSSTYFLEYGELLPQPFDSRDPFDEFDMSMPEEYYDFNGGRERLANYQKNIDTSRRITNGYGLHGVTRHQVSFLSESNDTNGSRVGMPLIIDNEEFNEILESGDENHGLIMARMTDSISMITNEGLLLTVDLTIPDELLVDDFKKLLPIWRKEIGIESVNVPFNNSWDVIRRKIVDYNIIPYIDLMAWSIDSRCTISQGVLAVSLFPSGEKDAFAIAQTIKPFVDKLMNEESLEKFRREISK